MHTCAKVSAGTLSVSIKDIAREAGLSHSTVSRALRDSPLISEETRERVQRLARELGYQPNALARGLRNQRTHTIGLILSSIADPYFGQLVRGFELEAERHDLTVVIYSSHGDPARELRAIDLFLSRQVDALAISTSRVTPEVKARLLEAKPPTLLINAETEGPFGLPEISVANAAGSQAATEHLLRLGHRRIAYLGIRGLRARTDSERERGYRRALEDAGIEIDPRWIARRPELPSDALVSPEPQPVDVEDGRALTPHLLAAGVTAIVGYNDMIALGAILAARDAGLDVPGDLSVVGFDDIELAQYLSPPLTTLRQDACAIGQRAVAMLHDLRGQKPVDDVMLPTQLVVRGSSAPPPKRK
ncbi:LacI family DNA-binding transcriptional regulator [Pseudenhygromyxa sp. WMMC2535]|uniref:LacI family DNA-binding transcriptional regulator n=1 Tax=Pseudenhygromyxa sp. WMMC2535 TaxID=2712867 RepID=UPI001595E628|nr:LacI family DNA-binding transcriptional regulator [Pseudenhygromyxa sp. WMMC2535]NVB41456.1 LacI family DNA-binding transcriptional regulator [Pseudenhygromyxa sp. WMMC2535]